MSSIRAISSTVTQRASKVLPYVLGRRGQKYFDVALMEVGLVAPLALVYLYHVGKSSSRDDHQSNSFWRLLQSLGEAAVTFGLVENTKKIFPGVALGNAAYEMGTAESKRDQLKAALKAAIVFPMGYLGIQGGLGMTDFLHRQDAGQIKHLVEQLLPTMNNTPANVAGNAIKADLMATVKNLEAKASGFLRLFSGKRYSLEHIKPATAIFQEAQDALVQKTGQLSSEQLVKLGRPTQEVLSKLVSHIQTSRGYSLIRSMNPLFAYLITVSFVSIPLFTVVSGSLFRKQGESLGIDEPPNIVPVWLHHFFDTSQDHGLGHTSPFLEVNGPKLLNDAWEGQF